MQEAFEGESDMMENQFTATISKEDESMTYRGMALTRQEVEFMSNAYRNYDDMKRKNMQDHEETYGNMEKYTG